MPQKLKRIRFLCFGFSVILLFYSTLTSADTLRSLYEAAVDSYNKEDYDRSIEIYKQIIKDAPQFSPAYIGLGLALKSQGADIQEVLYYYKTAVDKDPTNVQALEQLGRLYYSVGQLERAQSAFEKALKINPHISTVKLTLGWINLVGKKVNPKRAIIYFQDVLKSNPNLNSNANAYFGLGIAYFSDNQREKVLDIITQLKSMGQEDYASKLEKAVRENRKVIVNDVNSATVDQENTDSFDKTSDSLKGVKVRLRGKLDSLGVVNSN